MCTFYSVRGRQIVIDIPLETRLKPDDRFTKEKQKEVNKEKRNKREQIAAVNKKRTRWTDGQSGSICLWLRLHSTSLLLILLIRRSNWIRLYCRQPFIPFYSPYIHKSKLYSISKIFQHRLFHTFHICFTILIQTTHSWAQ